MFKTLHYNQYIDPFTRIGEMANLISPPGGNVDIKMMFQIAAAPEMCPSSWNEEFLSILPLVMIFLAGSVPWT